MRNKVVVDHSALDVCENCLLCLRIIAHLTPTDDAPLAILSHVHGKCIQGVLRAIWPEPPDGLPRPSLRDLP